jgi:hypothetical protein
VALAFILILPTTEKKLKVTVDWIIDLFFKRYVIRLKTFTEKKTLKGTVNQVTIQRASEKRLN